MRSHPGGVTGRSSLRFLAESEGPEILTDELWGAEPDRCTEPPFALGTGALEFGSYDKSGIGGR